MTAAVCSSLPNRSPSSQARCSNVCCPRWPHAQKGIPSSRGLGRIPVVRLDRRPRGGLSWRENRRACTSPSRARSANCDESGVTICAREKLAAEAWRRTCNRACPRNPCRIQAANGWSPERARHRIGRSPNRHSNSRPAETSAAGQRPWAASWAEGSGSRSWRQTSRGRIASATAPAHLPPTETNSGPNGGRPSPAGGWRLRGGRTAGPRRRSRRPRRRDRGRENPFRLIQTETAPAHTLQSDGATRSHFSAIAFRS